MRPNSGFNVVIIKIIFSFSFRVAFGKYGRLTVLEYIQCRIAGFKTFRRDKSLCVADKLN
jgi:hypothetical protein